MQNNPCSLFAEPLLMWPGYSVRKRVWPKSGRLGCRGHNIYFTLWIPSICQDLIEHMLQVDPEMRFSAAEVLDHPWVANDTAKDNKLHVAKELNQYFTRTKKPKDGLAVIA
ncbi:calcium/calmodulin-dependent protein kinase type 1-like, partial [Octopus sinensis]|uniref:Calcium/calmodulin-dependent protein kinase type 1-like n=1 Tax=Octopus sinensis TaxID=2607531 RepID=A0A7E6FUY9_9MOLL